MRDCQPGKSGNKRLQALRTVSKRPDISKEALIGILTSPNVKVVGDKFKIYTYIDISIDVYSAKVFCDS